MTQKARTVRPSTYRLQHSLTRRRKYASNRSEIRVNAFMAPELDALEA
jgi:hypothetical protein